MVHSCRNASAASSHRQWAVDRGSRGLGNPGNCDARSLFDADVSLQFWGENYTKRPRCSKGGTTRGLAARRRLDY
jgi:hypothetical protein